MEEVSKVLTQKLKVMADGEYCCSPKSKRKAMTALLPYAVLEEQNGQPEMLDMFLHTARASKERQFTWHHIGKIANKLLSKASPRAIILTSPYLHWDLLKDRGELVQLWAAATSAIPYTDEVGQSVVDVLLQIAAVDELVPHIPVDIWSWLAKKPPLPPVCLGRYVGTHACVVEAVRALKDVEVLKSYFNLVWSEWSDLQETHSFSKTIALIKEGLSGVEMAHHRAELIEQLDYILGQLDLRFGQLDPRLEHMQQDPDLVKFHLWKIKRQYGKFKKTLLKLDKRMSPPTTTLSHMLTPV